MCICALLKEFVREEPHTMFRKGREEGGFRILVSRYLVDDEKKYREYYRVSQDLFQTILSYIEECVSTVCPIRVNTLDSIINEQHNTPKDYQSRLLVRLECLTLTLEPN